MRASAVSVLAKFGILMKDLKPRILVLLRRCSYDNDDEVRDRATLYLSLLTDGLQNDQEDAQSILLQSLDMPLENLEAGLRSYVSDPIIHNHLISPAIS